jgi:hypothetical protein
MMGDAGADDLHEFDDLGFVWPVDVAGLGPEVWRNPETAVA